MDENDDEGKVIADRMLRDEEGNIIGYNFVDDNEDMTDEHGQGTHVAGTIAGGDFEGKIIPIKVTEDDGIEGSLYVLRDGEFEHIPVKGSTKKIAEGILYAAEHGDDIINMRLGAPESNEAIDEAIEYAASKGARIVVAAGDSEGDPLPPVLAVGAIAPEDERTKAIHEALIRRASMGISEKPKMSLTDIVLHAGAFVWSTLAGITGDYGNLGGYQGIYQRLEMGLAQLRNRNKRRKEEAIAYALHSDFPDNPQMTGVEEAIGKLSRFHMDRPT